MRGAALSHRGKHTIVTGRHRASRKIAIYTASWLSRAGPSNANDRPAQLLLSPPQQRAERLLELRGQRIGGGKGAGAAAGRRGQVVEKRVDFAIELAYLAVGPLARAACLLPAL